MSKVPRAQPVRLLPPLLLGGAARISGPVPRPPEQHCGGAGVAVAVAPQTSLHSCLPGSRKAAPPQPRLSQANGLPPPARPATPAQRNPSFPGLRVPPGLR